MRIVLQSFVFEIVSLNFPMSLAVQKIKEKIDIVTLVGTYVKLDKAGGSFKGKCPFHNEKTPSFFVSPDRNAYYCFGCHAKGDIFTFVQEFEGLDFVGALKVLADKAGVALDEFKNENNTKSEKDRLISVMELAKFYFEKTLVDENTAQEYLAFRGLAKDTIYEWNIGFVKAEWRGLYEYLLSKNISVEDMKKCGLIKQKEGTDSFYDTFRGRIMFPLFDSSGRTIAFSGRILVPDEKSAKYLNSPETVLFLKSEVLYGLDRAKYKIREMDYSILVEGQLDLIMLHQIGFKNTVASSGTALTESHLIKLQRLSNHIIMAFDGDSAGFTAISRGAQLALSLGMEVKIAKIEDGEDPASLALKDKELLKETIKNSQHIIFFILNSIIEKTADPRIVSKKIVSDVLPFVARVQSFSEQSFFLKHIAQKTMIKEEALTSDLKRIALEEKGVIPKTEIDPKNIEKIKRTGTILRKIIGVLWWQEEGLDKSKSKDLLEKIKQIVPEKEFKETSDLLEKEKDSLLFETESYYNNLDSLNNEIEDLLHNLSLEYLKKEFEEKMVALHRAESMHDESEMQRLLQECQNISKKINSIKNENEKK